MRRASGMGADEDAVPSRRYVPSATCPAPTRATKLTTTRRAEPSGCRVIAVACAGTSVPASVTALGSRSLNCPCAIGSDTRTASRRARSLSFLTVNGTEGWAACATGRSTIRMAATIGRDRMLVTQASGTATDNRKWRTLPLGLSSMDCPLRTSHEATVREGQSPGLSRIETQHGRPQPGLDTSRSFGTTRPTATRLLGSTSAHPSAGRRTGGRIAGEARLAFRPVPIPGLPGSATASAVRGQRPAP